MVWLGPTQPGEPVGVIEFSRRPSAAALQAFAQAYPAGYRFRLARWPWWRRLLRLPAIRVDL